MRKPYSRTEAAKYDPLFQADAESSSFSEMESSEEMKEEKFTESNFCHMALRHTFCTIDQFLLFLMYL